MAFKSGFVSILGEPNVGKSTLLNAFLGQKLSIITPKAQTTRHRILGIMNGDDFQIVFSDTPGVIKPHYKLHESMMKAVESAREDADLILLMIDSTLPAPDLSIYEQIKENNIPVIVVINKCDQSDKARMEAAIQPFRDLPGISEIVEISALHCINTVFLLGRILEFLPEHPAYYPEDELSDKNIRFFVSEIIREKIMLLYHQEIPYSAEVFMEEYKEEETIDRIKAIIFVSRESQKAILIGHQGKAIKTLGTEARKDIEEFVGKHVFLELSVKISKDWRDNELQLKRFGY